MKLHNEIDKFGETAELVFNFVVGDVQVDERGTVLKEVY